MNCMKCGRETAEDEVFCTICRKDMERHPVKPGTVIFLPTPAKTAPKKPVSKKKAIPSPEEQVASLKKTVLRLAVLAVLLTGIIVGLSFVAGAAITQLDVQRLLGQNYSTIEDTGE